MERIKMIIALLGSRALTVWMAGIFIMLYITLAVWSREAFATIIVGLTTWGFIRTCYLLLCLNVLTRVAVSLKRSWPDKKLFVLRTPLLVGLVVLLISIFFSLNARKIEWIIAGEGDVLAFPWETSSFRVVRIEHAIRQSTLVTAGSPLFAYEPAMDVEDDAGMRYRIGAFPPERIRSSYFHILRFGIGPEIELWRGKTLLAKETVPLNLIPFGMTDSFGLPSQPYRFFVTILPNRVVKKGRESASEYELDHPRYLLEVVKGERTIAKAETLDGMISFDDVMSLRFFPLLDWVHLEAVYDPFRTWFLAGLSLILIGFISYPVSLVSTAYHQTRIRTG